MSETHTPANFPSELPMLPLRDVVVFPHMVIPLFVGRPKSIKALEMAMEADRKIMLVAQKTAAKDDPSVGDMFGVGCVSTILQMLKLPDGTVKVLVEGVQRATVNQITEGEEFFTAQVTPIEPGDAADKASEIEALRRAVMQQFDQYVKLNKKIPSEILTSIAGLEDAGRLADTIAAHLPLKIEQKQEVLEMESVRARIERARFVQEDCAVDVVVAAVIAGEVIRVIPLHDGFVEHAVNFQPADDIPVLLPQLAKPAADGRVRVYWDTGRRAGPDGRRSAQCPRGPSRSSRPNPRFFQVYQGAAVAIMAPRVGSVTMATRWLSKVASAKTVASGPQQPTM